ncbi:hypothetical protein HY463_01815 [Candidatus Peregrinibacteria bacterium]|nr:hypothetical protein [Candidatus Peregrinibacteria bacterium]
MALEKPASWVESGRETKEAQTYMQKLQELKKDVFAKLKIEPRANFEMKDYTVVKGDTLGDILKNKITPFQNKDMLLYALTHMNVSKGANINVISSGEKVKVENGILKITNAKGQVRLSVELLPWPQTAPVVKNPEPIPILPFNKGKTLPDNEEL